MLKIHICTHITLKYVGQTSWLRQKNGRKKLWG